MSTLDIIICTTVISMCMSIVIGAIFYFKLEKKHDKEVRELHNLFGASQERQIFLEEKFIEHMKRYH